MPLHIVATPIGNLEDITERALRILREADLCYAEDTRNSSQLFRRFGIETRLLPYHDHSSDSVREDILRKLEEGLKVALISDAGTPCISDPGYKLVRTAREAGYVVEPIPGASALVAFLSAAGLPTDRFTFGGFLPSKQNARRERLSELLGTSMTSVVYESPNRLEATLNDLYELDSKAEVVVAREITKMFETWIRGNAREVRDSIDAAQGWRGEIVLGFIASPKEGPQEGEIERWVSTLLDAGLSARSIGEVLQERLGVKKKDAYQLALSLQSNDEDDK